ncbi:MAG: hypothetical protein LBJ36_11130, partial [Synergistaceae bacterium]|nr:hypothetical protein [Synergistaceae bacterium]
MGVDAGRPKEEAQVTAKIAVAAARRASQASGLPVENFVQIAMRNIDHETWNKERQNAQTETQTEDPASDISLEQGINPDVPQISAGEKAEQPVQKADDARNNAKMMKMLDAQYLAAVNAGDMETAQKIIDDQARNNGYVPISDIPKDDWTNLYSYPHEYDDYESFYTMRQITDSPGRIITMFSAVPKTVKEGSFRNGDWITPSRDYAQREGKSLPGGYKIIQQRVNLKDIWWNGKSLDRFR